MLDLPDIVPWCLALVFYIKAGRLYLASIMAQADAGDAGCWASHEPPTREAARAAVLILGVLLWPVVLATGRLFASARQDGR